MKKFILLASCSLCYSILTANTWAEKYTGSECHGTCTYEYDSETYTMTFSGTGDITGARANGGGGYDFFEYMQKKGMLVKNLIINEGITGATVGFTMGWGTSDGILKIPSTFVHTTWGNYLPVIWDNNFGTIEVSPNTSEQTVYMPLGMTNSHTLIITASDNMNYTIERFINGNDSNNWGFPEHIQVKCRGDIQKCQSMIKNRNTNVTYEYYIGYDNNGNPIEIWDENGKKTYSYKYLANGDYKKYDGDGNFLGSFMADGSKRRIYRVDEATAVTEGKNTFSIKYR